VLPAIIKMLRYAMPNSGEADSNASCGVIFICILAMVYMIVAVIWLHWKTQHILSRPKIPTKSRHAWGLGGSQAVSAVLTRSKNLSTTKKDLVMKSLQKKKKSDVGAFPRGLGMSWVSELCRGHGN
jgi:hypothetical protein